MPTLLLACLNFNGADSLRASIQSVLNQTVGPDRFVVIDNASTDDSRQIAVEMGVEVVDADNLHKFITGLNTAMDLAKDYDYLFFMQNDVTLEPDCVELMLEGCPVQNFFAQPVIHDSRWNIDNAGMDYYYPGFGLRRNKKWWKGYLWEECGLVTTICFMTDMKVYWDTRFSPAYYEDLDIYLRTKDMVLHVLIPHARTVHIGNHTFSQSYEKTQISYICRDHREKLIKKHYHGIDREIRLAVSSGINIVAEAKDIITKWWAFLNKWKKISI